MPIYEYACCACGYAFEHLARTLADTAKTCPKCGARDPRKQLSSFSTSDNTLPPACPVASCPSPTCSTGKCCFD